MKSINLIDICEFIWMLEKKYDLFNWNINNVYIWEIVRFKIYRQISEAVKLFSQGHTQSKNNLIGNTRRLIKTKFFEIKKGALKKNYKKNILIFENPRKIKFEDKYIDPYTYFYIKEQDNLDEFEIIDSSYLLSHYKTELKVRYNDHFSFTDFIKSRLLKIEDDDKPAILQAEINRYFNIKMDLKNIIFNSIRNFNFNENYYLKLFKKREPKQIFLVCSYGHHALIAAAKKLNIKVTEFQHGVMSKYHLGYSFPDKNTLFYFPDEIYFFGKYWIDAVPLPSGFTKVIYGYPYLQKISNHFAEVSKNQKQILFLSQGIVGHQLSELAVALAGKLKNYSIILKLHPGEYARWEDYPALSKIGSLANFTLVADNETHLYELFASSEYTIGVSSTGIYEAIFHRCKIILLDLPGIEIMDFLINKGVHVVTSGDDIISLIQNEKIKTLKANNFFEL